MRILKNKSSRNYCVLGIAASSRGFGFAVMMRPNLLIDWGVKAVKGGNKNEKCLARVAELIEVYKPYSITLEKWSAQSRRSPRIQALINEIASRAASDGIEVTRVSRKLVNLRILRNPDRTKHLLAEKLATIFPEQLSFRLPKRRRLWTSEPYQMDIFDAVALAATKCSTN